MKRALALSAAVLSLAAWGAPKQAHAQQYVTTVLFGGLDNPRHLLFGPDGALYVAEAGRGGGGAGIVSGDGAFVQYGDTGGVTRYQNGGVQRIVSNLPSLAPQSGPDAGGGATGLHSLAFGTDGKLYGVIGLGANPALRSGLGADGDKFAQFVCLEMDGSNHVMNIADLGAFEVANNPDRGMPDSNPYGLKALPNGGFLIADAGGNSLLFADSGGAVSALTALPSKPNPLPFGPPFYQAVPTSVTLGPDGAYYIGQLTGFPFPQGGASVYRYDPATGALTEAYTGFTNIIDLAFGADNTLYVLEISANGLADPNGPVPGALIRVGADGTKTTIAGNLLFPAGLEIGSDGSFYVSNLGVAPFAGHVLRIQAVPEPGTCALLAGAFVGTALLARRRRSKK